MPPLQALAALHGFWFMILGLPLVWVIRQASPSRLWQIRRVLLLLSLTGIAVVIGHTLLVWLRELPDERRGYVVERLLFVIGTLGCDVWLGRMPVAQLAV